MDKIIQDINSKQFESVYLFSGKETYLLRQYKNNLVKALRDGADDMNYSFFEGKGISVSEVVEMAETMPFFADRRVIVIQDSGFFAKATPDMVDYIENIADTCNMVFIEREVDKRGRLFKAVKSKGYACIIDGLDDKKMTQWIGQTLRKDGIRVQQNTVDHLISKVGKDMEILKLELEKLACYCMGKDVLSIEDIDTICVGQPVDKIFDIADRMMDKDSKMALKYYYDLRALNIASNKILSTMTAHFRRLLYVKSMSIEGFNRDEIAKVAGINSYYLHKYIGQAKGYTQEELNAILEEVVDMTYSSRSGGIDVDMAVELLIVKYSTS